MTGDDTLLGGPHPCLGQTDNARFYLLSPSIIAVVPFVDSEDDARTSLQSIRFQESYWRGRGLRGGSIIFMDRVLRQDWSARQNYKTAPDRALFTGFALVTESLLGRAVSAMHLGLSAPSIPTRVFASQREAKQWLTSTRR